MSVAKQENEVPESPKDSPRRGRIDQLETETPQEPPSRESETGETTSTQAPAAAPRSWLDAIGSELFFFGAMAVAVVILMRATLRRRKRGGDVVMQQVGEVKKWGDRNWNQGRALADAPADLRRWHVELEEIARDVRGEIDTKIRLLQAVIRSAAEERQRLEEAIARAERAGITDGASPAPDPRGNTLGG